MPREVVSPLQVDALAWAKQDGLLPVIVQDAATLRVLMLGYMDRAALETTLAQGKVTFYSRSRQRQWTKGEQSGHFLQLVSIEADCDDDTLLVLAHPQGPTCHLQRTSCFPSAPGDFLAELQALVAQRERERPSGSYTTRLFEGGVRTIAQKVGEEGVETALAAVAQGDAELAGEAADLLYHLLVLLRARGLSLADALSVLRSRHRVSAVAKQELQGGPRLG
jgi:phosphoribosyl-ATP pyrophosphohydrolase/phosphoribosyl-AMP cyclohydrolase